MRAPSVPGTSGLKRRCVSTVAALHSAVVALPPGPRGPVALTTLRFGRRPLDMLRRWQARYGNVFTVRLTGFGTGVYVAEPEAIRVLFTGDQSDLRAGEANSVLEPVVGPHSVLVLDGPEHMRQRKLLLPPFQGSRVAGFREVIREVAEREVAGWQAGDRLVLRDRMRALTFEVICRVVFGVTEAERVERLRVALSAVIDLNPLYMVLPVLRRDLGPLSPGRRFQRRLRAADALLNEEIARRRQEPDLDAAHRRPVAAAAGAGRGGTADDRRRAARRAVHDARRGARDHGDRPGVRVRAAAAQPARARPAAARRSRPARATTTSTPW